jgi:3-deoxy-manno-octulosonate cytidylyltransferase (CMP-KDO synthetase)
MKNIGIIPARMGSSRFPNKPMVFIHGIPMIGHCYYRSLNCSDLDEVYVATCDQEIYDYIESIGGKVIMTSNTHGRATERVAEALLILEAKHGGIYENIVMIQGDEPLIYPEMISELLNPMISENHMISNLISPLLTQKQIGNPNNVKVVFAKNMNMLYLTREPIPSNKIFLGVIDSYRQLGIIAFKSMALKKFISLGPSRLEIIESIDMNRFLENETDILCVITKKKIYSVDVPSDLDVVNKKMELDHLFRLYSQYANEE